MAEPGQTRILLSQGGPALREIGIALGIVCLAAVVALVDDSSGIRSWWQLRDDLRASQARMDTLRERIRALEGEAERLGEDPLTIEHAIRADLGWARPGEIVVEIPEPAVPAPPRP